MIYNGSLRDLYTGLTYAYAIEDPAVFGVVLRVALAHPFTLGRQPSPARGLSSPYQVFNHQQHSLTGVVPSPTIPSEVRHE